MFYKQIIMSRFVLQTKYEHIFKIFLHSWCRVGRESMPGTLLAGGGAGWYVTGAVGDEPFA